MTVSSTARSDFLTFYGTVYKGGDDICAWPGYATVEDLAGLPPHVISLNECDPIRDEGKEYFQKLSRAGVSVTGRMTLGTVHMGEYMTESYPECTRQMLNAIREFMYYGCK